MVGNHERLNPLDDPEGPDVFEYPESQEEEPPFDLFDDYQETEQKPLLPHQLAFRNFVRLNRIDPAAFTSTSMFNYDLITPEANSLAGHLLSTSPSVKSAPDITTQIESRHAISPALPQDPFAQTSMPLAAQQERYARIESISHLIVAHLDKGDITEQSLNNFLRKNLTTQFQ